MTHYVENMGTEDVIFIEVLQADHFSGMPSSTLLELTSSVVLTPEISEN